MLTALLLLATAAPPAGPLPDPASAVRAALADVRRLPAGRQVQARYLSLYHLPAVEQARWEKVLRFWANSLSSEVDLTYPVRVAPGLWRVYLDDYGWKREVWEKLLDVPEPYFHVRILKVIEDEREWGYWRDQYGRQVKEGTPGASWVKTRVEKVKKRQTQAVAAPWLPPAETADLILRTQTQIPIVRGDWWLFQTGIAKDRKAGYYDWLNLGQKESDFQRLVGVDVKLAKRVKRELRAVIGRSGVTLQAREIEEFDAVTGPYWRSLDYDASTDRKNPLRLLDGDAEPVATEQFGVLPNGLFAYWLGAIQQKGQEAVRQDAAPDNIASDGTVRGNDRRVHVGRNCLVCHQEGLRPINDWARRIYTPPFSLDSVDYAKQKRLRQIYLGDLKGKLEQGNSGFARVLLSVNGLTPPQNAKAFAAAWDGYAEDDRGIEETAREVGLPAEQWAARLKAAAAAGKALDPVLAALVQGLPVRAEFWEEVFPQAMQIARTP